MAGRRGPRADRGDAPAVALGTAATKHPELAWLYDAVAANA